MKELPVYLLVGSALIFIILFVATSNTQYMIIGLLAMITSILMRMESKS